VARALVRAVSRLFSTPIPGHDDGDIVSSPHHQDSAFDERNNFLAFLLGLHSIAATITEQLRPTANNPAQQRAETPAQTARAESILR
jgi:hypothetical protein